jgi:hypothetical protein
VSNDLPYRLVGLGVWFSLRVRKSRTSPTFDFEYKTLQINIWYVTYPYVNLIYNKCEHLKIWHTDNYDLNMRNGEILGWFYVFVVACWYQCWWAKRWHNHGNTSSYNHSQPRGQLISETIDWTSRNIITSHVHTVVCFRCVASVDHHIALPFHMFALSHYHIATCMSHHCVAISHVRQVILCLYDSIRHELFLSVSPGWYELGRFNAKEWILNIQIAAVQIYCRIVNTLKKSQDIFFTQHCCIFLLIC